jgi:hypothetical protein
LRRPCGAPLFPFTLSKARRRRIAAVEDGVLFGIPTNRGFLLSALKHQAAANHARGWPRLTRRLLDISLKLY